MTARYVLTPLAEADLDTTWDYAAERFGFDIADLVLESWSLFTQPFDFLQRTRESVTHARTLRPLPTRSGQLGLHSSRFART